jgi:hypothetical protein
VWEGLDGNRHRKGARRHHSTSLLTLFLVVGFMWSASAQQQVDPKLVGNWQTYDGPCRPCVLSIQKSGTPIRRLLSRGKTSPLPTFLHFFAEGCCLASRSRFAVLLAPVSSVVVMSLALWRRTRHPSGSRPMRDTSPYGQASGPLARIVPQKTLGTLPCPIVMITVHVALPEGSIPQLARGRGVAKT